MDDFEKVIKEILKKNMPKEAGEIVLERPPDQEMGDYAYPCFPLAKVMRKSPNEIASELCKKITPEISQNIEKVEAKGPYLNFFVNKETVSENVLKEIQKKKEDYGKGRPKKEKILVETPGPNTNKPLHLGHLRNILLGTTIANILTHYGKEVHIVNVVNDRGVHICKSILAYQKLGEGDTPEKAGRKSDHFVGDYYVKYGKLEKADKEKTEKEVQEMLIAWEKGDKKVIKTWEKMNRWALDGFKETYKRLGLKIEKEYYESETYKFGKDIILDGLAKGIFEKDENGAIVLDLEDKGLGKKVLLRANGTTLYITQDLYMAKRRYEDFKFDGMVYVVGNEQDYHFKVLFEIFKRLGNKFWEKCYHFSYGMVELPEGKMKSREGTVIDTDDLIDSVVKIAKEEVKKRYKDLDESEVEERADAIAMAAIRFFFLKFDAVKNFVFNTKESLNFEGETGPYVQYTHARICSIIRKYLEESKEQNLPDKIDYSTLKEKEENHLIQLLSDFSFVVAESAEKYKPHLLCRYLLDLCQAFNEFYHKESVLQAESVELKGARLILIDSVRQVIANGLGLLNIVALEKM